MKRIVLSVVLCLQMLLGVAQTRIVTDLNGPWQTVYSEKLPATKSGDMSFNAPKVPKGNWRTVNVPHNWDAYEGYRRMRHGNLHGYAWYQKTFTHSSYTKGKRLFLYFEGVGSYATVWLNGKKIGYHAGGRTTFTFDVTGILLTNGKPNTLQVRADHPAEIRDLPWVCGGCSDERGFSEGSQPLGIFRPVSLIETNDTRIEPFGVHVWNGKVTNKDEANLEINTTIKNYKAKPDTINLRNSVFDAEGILVSNVNETLVLKEGDSVDVKQAFPTIRFPKLWSPKQPYLYKVKTQIYKDGELADELVTPYGVRWTKWPTAPDNNTNQFFINDTAVFINGIAEYEHIIGGSHAFSKEQIKTRAMMIKAAGFNAFRDGHQPHHLEYQHYWDSLGIMWWTQLSAHVWFDNDEFKKNFKTLLREWVIERRNSPSVIMYGLQNESTIPEDFAKECTELIRRLDPGASIERPVTTCNGGKGTDWDVPQNWTGTYGGNPMVYDDNVKRQKLVGEYGAWRTIDLHTEGGFIQEGVPYSEDRMTQLMEMKVRLAESARDSSSGHFFWLLTSHDNPGRVQAGEGLRELDRIGPVNYKGLLTPWEEPLDVYYMYRSHYAPKTTEPMVYIVSQTWPNRWTTPGRKNGITIYSNCDGVELFNVIDSISLGMQISNGRFTHYSFNNVNVQYNVLYAVGYVNGKIVARDTIVLNYLPEAKRLKRFRDSNNEILKPADGYKYIYRVNAGGPQYTDRYKNTWQADRAYSIYNSKEYPKNAWGSSSWANSFNGTPLFFASQRQTYNPVKGVTDWPLIQSFRYGREQLAYHFPVTNGEYLVELFFVEPWFGKGGGLDATGWRQFDVAINGKVVLKDFDIYKEAGYSTALKKTIPVTVTNGVLKIDFPYSASSQAVISAIAIASKNANAKAVPATNGIIKSMTKTKNWELQTWMNTGDRQFGDTSVAFLELPPVFYGVDWFKKSTDNIDTLYPLNFVVDKKADVFVAVPVYYEYRADSIDNIEDAKMKLVNTERDNNEFKVYRIKAEANTKVVLPNKLLQMAQTIAVVPVSSVEPAYDLKTAVTYRSNEAMVIGSGLVVENINDRPNVRFTKPARDTLQFVFQLGVADKYSFQLRYANMTDKVMKGRLQMLSADGVLMREEPLEFTKSKPGKWNYINTDSGSMINAGTYWLRIISTDAEGLGVSNLEVQ